MSVVVKASLVDNSNIHRSQVVVNSQTCEHNELVGDGSMHLDRLFPKGRAEVEFVTAEVPNFLWGSPIRTEMRSLYEIANHG